MNKKKNILIYIIAFMVPFGILSLSFALLGIYPFGNRQVLVIDAWNQYYPFLVELNRKLRSGESLLYSWRLGMGSDFVSLMAYYLASPLNLLLILFPESILKEIFTLFILIKTGLAGSFCACALNRINAEEAGSREKGGKQRSGREKERKQRGRKGQEMTGTPGRDKSCYGVIIFSTFYALCGWNIGYYWNIMWLDTFALLPLVALGICLLVREKKFKLYTISLALAILANYYIGIMVCIFTAIFFFVQCFLRQNSRKELWNNLKNIILYSILAIMMSAVVLLPTMVTLGHAYESSSGPAKQLTARGWLENFSNLFAYLEPTQMGGHPYLYSGVVCILLLIVYCRLPKVFRREKGAYLSAILFVFAGTNINILNYIWHGFHGANSLPYRFTFIFSFLLVIPAYRAYRDLDTLRRKDWKIVCIAGGLCWLLVAADRLYRFGKESGVSSAADLFQAEGKELGLFLIKNLLLILTYLVLMTLATEKKWNGTAFTLSLAIVAGLELVPTVLAGTKAIGTTDRDSFPDRYAQVEEALDEIREAEVPSLGGEEGNDTFYRTELTARHGWNASALYDYNGTAIFSSTANAAITEVFEKLGMAAWQAANRYHYQNSTPVNNLFLNLKYLISRGAELVNREYLTEAARADDVSVYENKAYLPIGFMVESEAADFSFEGDTPFEIQNHLLKVASGIEEDVFEAMDMIHVGHENVYVTRSDYGRYQYKPLEDRGEPSGENQTLQEEEGLSGERQITSSGGTLTEESRASGAGGNTSEHPQASETGGGAAGENSSSGNGSRMEKEKFKYNYEMPKDGVVYVFMDLRPEKTAENTAKVEFDGVSRSYAIYHNGSFFPAGTYQKGDLFSVRSEMDAGKSGKLRIFVSILNQEVFDRAYDILKDETLDVTEWTSRSLKGNITVKKDNLMYTSIPYEKGWKVYVDGKKADIKLIFDAFIGVELTEGEHEIELVYSPGHVYLALVISLMGIGVFGLLCALKKNIRPRLDVFLYWMYL